MPGKETQHPLHSKLGGHWGWSSWIHKISPPPGSEPQTVQPVISCYTHCWGIIKSLGYDNVSSDRQLLASQWSLLIQSRSTQTLKTGKTWALKMEAASSSKTLVTIYHSKWCHIPEDLNTDIWNLCRFWIYIYICILVVLVNMQDLILRNCSMCHMSSNFTGSLFCHKILLCHFLLTH